MTLSKYAVVALIGTTLSQAPALADPIGTTRAAGKDASWLFIQTASEVQFDGKTLTLKNVGPSMVMFTDRPARMAESIPTAAFVQHWNRGGNNSFQAKPPNAGLTSVVDGKLQTATVELSQPNLNGTTLTYQARVLKGAPPPRGAETSIFFDDIHWNPGGF